MFVIFMLRETRLQIIINQILASAVNSFKIILNFMVVHGTYLAKNSCETNKLSRAQSFTVINICQPIQIIDVLLSKLDYFSPYLYYWVVSFMNLRFT